ncbi:MAG TPA: response regulator [Acetobacteraceae bacterium]
MSWLRRLLRRRRDAAPVGLIERLGGQPEGKPSAALDGIVPLLFDDAPFGLMVVDRDGRIIRVNDARRRMVARGVGCVAACAGRAGVRNRCAGGGVGGGGAGAGWAAARAAGFRDAAGGRSDRGGWRRSLERDGERVRGGAARSGWHGERGVRVRVYLPRWDAQEAVAIPRMPKPAAELAPAPAVAPRVVLLVEDEEPVRRLAERTLIRQGWRVIAAENVEAALARLEAEGGAGVSVLATDMVMPGLDGAALVWAVRAKLGAPRLPAVLVSGYAEETLRRDLDAAATTFLPKPYSLKELAAKLEAQPVM